MKIVVGSQSLAKKKYFEELFKKYDVEFIVASELGINEPIEDGKTSYENALIKARYYSKKSGYPCIALDSSLLFLDFPHDHKIQVGAHVKSPYGVELSPIELKDYYKNLAHDYGGKLRAEWIDAYALVSNTFEYCKSYADVVDENIGFYLVDEEHERFEKHQPMDTISKKMNPFMFFYDYYDAIDNGLIIKGDSPNKYSLFVDNIIDEMAKMLGLKEKL